MSALAARSVLAAPRRLALVEDDANTQRAMELLLCDEGWDVRSFGDATSALAALRTGDFQALVTDHVLPGMQGIELVELVQRELPAVRCVIVSGYEAPARAKRAALRWLLKPVDFDALVRELSAP